MFLHLILSSNFSCFIYSAKYGLRLIFFHIDIQLFLHHFWKRLIYPLNYPITFSPIINYHRNDWLRTKLLLCNFMGQQSEKGSAGQFICVVSHVDTLRCCIGLQKSEGSILLGSNMAHSRDWQAGWL